MSHLTRFTLGLGLAMVVVSATPAAAQDSARRAPTPSAERWQLTVDSAQYIWDVRLVDVHPYWTVYEWPSHVVVNKPPAKTADRLGQAHKWFIFEPLDGVALAPVPDMDEFVAWQWMTPAELTEQVVEFRRPGYEQVLLA